MNQSELEVNTRDRRQHGIIKQAMSWKLWFALTYKWLRKWLTFLKPVAERIKTKPNQHVDFIIIIIIIYYYCYYYLFYLFIFVAQLKITSLW